MLAEIYIEALLVDEELANQVRELWDAGEIDDYFVCCAWRRISTQSMTLGAKNRLQLSPRQHCSQNSDSHVESILVDSDLTDQTRNSES